VHLASQTTMDAVDILSQLARRNRNIFSYAGTKDKRGVTTQLCSAYMLRAVDCAALNKRLIGLRVGNFSYRGTKIELGALSGAPPSVTVPPAPPANIREGARHGAGDRR
jgi:tRNA pseudouridine13 synthase